MDPRLIIVIRRDSNDYARVLLYSHYTGLPSQRRSASQPATQQYAHGVRKVGVLGGLEVRAGEPVLDHSKHTNSASA